MKGVPEGVDSEEAKPEGVSFGLFVGKEPAQPQVIKDPETGEEVCKQRYEKMEGDHILALDYTITFSFCLRAGSCFHRMAMFRHRASHIQRR